MKVRREEKLAGVKGVKVKRCFGAVSDGLEMRFVGIREGCVRTTGVMRAVGEDREAVFRFVDAMFAGTLR